MSENTFNKNLNSQALDKIEKFKSIANQSFIKTRQDRFLILCREFGTEAINLEAIFSNIGKTEVICDTPHQEKGIWYSNEEAQGFQGLMGHMKFPKITAWSRAFLHLEKTGTFNERVWFIEEDVAGHPEAFRALVNIANKYPADLCSNFFRTPKDNPEWYWWRYLPDKDWFTNPVSTFNPLCNMSSELVRDILSFREEKGRFTFLESLFASVAFVQGKSILDWQRLPETKYLFGTFHWRPEIDSLRLGISHPIKNPELHTLISGISE